MVVVSARDFTPVHTYYTVDVVGIEVLVFCIPGGDVMADTWM
jgi:hypothetical protein